MQLRTNSFVEDHAAGRQQYLSRSGMRAPSSPSEFTIAVPGACTCCEGCTSSSCAW
jgi:hypothetical protein